jgi:hypothetical protein
VQTALALAAVFLLWTVVVSLFVLFMLLMVWLTSRILPLIGRRR